jgi:uncharacterized damage-inducible protein DinB
VSVSRGGCEIWRGFAKRGLGVGADQGLSSSRTDGVENFDLPASCTAATFGGFTPPVENPPAINAANAGSTIPVKFTLVGGAPAGIDSQAVDCSRSPSLSVRARPVAPPVSFGRWSRLRRVTISDTEWWQRGPIQGVPPVLQPVAHILLQVRDSVGEMVAGLSEDEWNRRPADVASAAFHVRHITGVIDRLFTYARGQALSDEQRAAIKLEGSPLAITDVARAIEALSNQVDAAIAELKTTDVTTLGDFRGIGRAQLPSTVIGCLVHGAEHAMRHVGQLSVTIRVVRPPISGRHY